MALLTLFRILQVSLMSVAFAHAGITCGFGSLTMLAFAAGLGSYVVEIAVSENELASPSSSTRGRT